MGNKQNKAIEAYNNQLNKNYIIAEIKIEKFNLERKIINHDVIEKDFCDIYINNKKITFTDFYNFPKEGNYRIIYIFKKPLLLTNYMFSDCYSLISLDLSNFNTQNVINMRNMFSNCNSLISLNLFNFNTQNV